MHPLPDPDLLRRYVATRDEAAFSELVARHGGMVRSAAERLAPRDADDVTQAVFLLLSRRAASLVSRRTVAGWLYETTRHVSSNARRARAREQARIDSFRETTMSDASAPSAASGPQHDVDAALASLSEADRQVVLLRYVEGRTLEETGALLAATPAAVAKRAERALGRLRSALSPRGVGGGAVASALAVPGLSPAEVAGVARAVHAGEASAAAKSLATLPKSPLVSTGALKAGACLLVVTAAAAVQVMRSGEPTVVAAAGRPSVAAPAADQGGAREAANAFLAALRDRDVDRLAGMVASESPAAGRALAEKYVLELRDRAYAAFPERLTLTTNSSFTLNAAQEPVEGTVESASPTMAEVAHLAASLKHLEGGWRITEARLAGVERMPPGMAGDAYPEALQLWAMANADVRSFGPRALSEKDLPRLRASLATLRSHLVQLADRLKGTDLAMTPGDLDVFCGEVDRADQAFRDLPFADAVNVLRDGLEGNPELAAAAGRLQALGDELGRRADMSEDVARSSSRLPAVGPDVELALAWSGRTVRLPGPLVVPAWLRETAQYKHWRERHDAAPLTARDDAGNVYRFAAQAAVTDPEGRTRDVIPRLYRFRPDGTLEATAEYSFDGQLQGWSRVDVTGRRYVFRATVMESPAGHRLAWVRFFDARGEIRGWEFRDDGKTAWWDYASDPVGQHQQTIHLVHQNGLDDLGPHADPGLPPGLREPAPTSRP